MIKIFTEEGIFWGLQINDNWPELKAFVKAKGRESLSDLSKNDDDKLYFSLAMSNRDAEEEYPENGQYYVAHPDHHLVLYTRGEFIAKFKVIEHVNFDPEEFSLTIEEIKLDEVKKDNKLIGTCAYCGENVFESDDYFDPSFSIDPVDDSKEAKEAVKCLEAYNVRVPSKANHVKCRDRFIESYIHVERMISKKILTL
jgi:hypothetical protein